MKENILFDAVPNRTATRLKREIKTRWILDCTTTSSDNYPNCRKIFIYQVPQQITKELRWYVRGWLDADWYENNKKHIPR